MEKRFNGFYEDEDSVKMMDVINKQADIEYKKNLKEQIKENKRKKITNTLCVIGSITLFAIVMVWIVILNTRLNKQDMNSCLKNNSQEYCNTNIGWVVK